MQSRAIPFDALTLAAVADELRRRIGAKVQDARASSLDTLAIELYRNGAREWFLLSCHARLARAHFVSRRPENLAPPSALVGAVRARLVGARLARVVQVAGDRVLRLDFTSVHGPQALVAELMGKHSNLVLLDSGGRIVTAAKTVPATRSRRPIVGGTAYVLPPVLREAPDLETSLPPEAVRRAVGGRFAESLGSLPAEWRPIYARGQGAYPVPLDVLGIASAPRETISAALETHFAALLVSQEFDDAKQRLSQTISRLRAARAATLRELLSTEAEGREAQRRQLHGELILAYGPTMPPNARELETVDYDGNAVSIPLRPELSLVENANLHFDGARRARLRREEVEAAIGRFRDEVSRLESFAARLDAARLPADLNGLRIEADRARWTIRPAAPVRREERPFEGHRIRELLSPAGFPVLYGETATANDHLTLKVARPGDLWFHVRGGASAHVILRTGGKPERVQRPDLEFAALVAARHSKQKGSRLVAVDVTERRHVRRPRGAAVGEVRYERERTLHVSPGESQSEG